jgi:EAL domain-containing protein (putative c-di-GMP-specific phosphodiesterase class I)
MPTTPEGILLHHALRSGDPVILFQPILDLSTGLVTGYEALSRFTTLPDLAVDAVFDLAQQLGQGYHLEVLAVLKAMEAGAARPPGTVLSVNLSPSSLCHPALLEALPDDLSGLQVEITEHESIEYVGLFAERLDELRDRGVRIAVDDVGEAYAGLQRVMRIRPDLLKVDRSLVMRVHERPEQAALLEAVVHFAARTGALVCAEGVECAEELAVLADLDITYGQGFFIGRPGPGFPEPHPHVRQVCERTMANAVAVQDASGPSRLVHALLQVASAGSLDGLARVLDDVAPAVGADTVELSYLDWERTYVEAVVDGAAPFKGVRYHLADYPLTRRVLEHDVAAQVVLGSPDADPSESEWMVEDGVGSLLMLPARSGGRVVGLFESHRRDPAPWRRSQIRAARTIAAVAGPVLENLLRGELPQPPSRIPQGEPYAVSRSRNGTASKASGPSTPVPDHAPPASSSSATTGLTAVCHTTACEPYCDIDHSLSTTW